MPSQSDDPKVIDFKRVQLAREMATLGVQLGELPAHVMFAGADGVTRLVPWSEVRYLEIADSVDRPQA